MRSQKEIARYVKADAEKHRVKLGWKQKGALIAICSVKEIQHTIERELNDIKQGRNNLAQQMDVLEEKIRLAPENDQQRMIELGKEIKKIVGKLEFYNRNFEDFSVFDYLLAMLHEEMDTSRRWSRWSEIKKEAKRLKLAKLMQRSNAAGEIGAMLKQSLEGRYNFNIHNLEQESAYVRERENWERIMIEARKLVPKPATTEEDIINRIREKGAERTDVKSAKASNADDDGTLAVSFA